MINWERYKLGDIVDYINGGAWPASAYTDRKGIPVVRVTDIQNFTIDLSGCKYLKPEFRDKYEKHQLQTGDLIICTVGSHPTQQSSVVGKTAAVNEKIAGAYLNQNAILLRAKEEYLDKSWLSFFARTSDFKEHVESNARGSANQVRLAISSLLEMEFELPPLEEQRRIAEILSALDDKIELNRCMNQTLEQMAQTLFRQYFVDGIDEENLPEGWRIGKLGDVSKNVRKTVNPKELQEESKYVGLEHIPRKSIALTDWSTSVGVESQKYRFEQNHILFGKLRPYFHKVILAPFEGICSTDILVIEPLKEYMLAFCLLHYSSEEVVQYSNQLSHGTRMPRADWNGLSGYEIAIPPTELFIKFNNLILPSLQKIKANIEEIQTLTQLRDTLLPKLMSGEIDVMQIKPEELHEPVLS